MKVLFVHFIFINIDSNCASELLFLLYQSWYKQLIFGNSMKYVWYSSGDIEKTVTFLCTKKMSEQEWNGLVGVQQKECLCTTSRDVRLINNQGQNCFNFVGTNQNVRPCVVADQAHTVSVSLYPADSFFQFSHFSQCTIPGRQLSFYLFAGITLIFFVWSGL